MWRLCTWRPNLKRGYFNESSWMRALRSRRQLQSWLVLSTRCSRHSMSHLRDSVTVSRLSTSDGCSLLECFGSYSHSQLLPQSLVWSKQVAVCEARNRSQWLGSWCSRAWGLRWPCVRRTRNLSRWAEIVARSAKLEVSTGSFQTPLQVGSAPCIFGKGELQAEGRCACLGGRLPPDAPRVGLEGRVPVLLLLVGEESGRR